MAGLDEVFRGGLGCGVWAARPEWVSLYGQRVGASDVAIDLIGTDMQESTDTMLSAGIEQHLCSGDIGMNKRPAVDQTPVNMALGGKIDHHITASNGLVHGLRVGNITANELNLSFQPLQIGWISTVSEQIQHSNRPFGVISSHHMDVVGSDEPSTSGDEHRSFCCHGLILHAYGIKLGWRAFVSP